MIEQVSDMESGESYEALAAHEKHFLHPVADRKLARLFLIVTALWGAPIGRVTHSNLSVCLAHASLSPKEQADLCELFARASEAEQIATATVLSAHPAWVARVQKNLVKKQKVLMEGDAEAWQKLLTDELAEILAT